MKEEVPWCAVVRPAVEADFDPTCENILFPFLIAYNGGGHQAVKGLGVSEQISVTPSIRAAFRKPAILVLPLDGTREPSPLLQFRFQRNSAGGSVQCLSSLVSSTVFLYSRASTYG